MLQNLKSILIGITYDAGEDDKPSSALAYGLSLAHQANAHVTALSTAIRLTGPHSVLSSLMQDLVGQENRRLAALARAAGEKATSVASLEGLSCTTENLQLSYNELVDIFTARARVNDLAVLDAENTPLSADRGLIYAAVFESGRPAIVVPARVTEFKGERILIAWDGSARASRAVHDALPFLLAASSVSIVQVSGDKDLSKSVPGGELKAYLASHGIAAEVTDLPAKSGEAVDALRRHAADNGFDMIVMGAFVRSWIRQITLGGFTRALLDESPVPVFLAH